MTTVKWLLVAAALIALPAAGQDGAARFAFRQATVAELEQLGLRTAGALVVEAAPASLAGTIRPGDILAFAGTKPLVQLGDLGLAVEQAQGKEIDLLYYRDGMPDSVAVRLASDMLPAALGTAAGLPPAGGRGAVDAGPDSRPQVSAEVQRLLAPGGNPNGRDSIHGRTALIWAARLGDAAAFERLLAAGAGVDARDGEGLTALMHFCQAEDHGVAYAFVLPLLARGADPRAVDIYDRPVLYHAIEKGNLGCARLLLDHGVDANHGATGGYPPPLAYAAALGQVGIMAALLERGAAIDGVDSYGRTALMLAADNGQFEAARWLLERGADMDLADAAGRTALQVAAMPRSEPPLPAYRRKKQERLRIIELLRRSGAR